MKDDQTLMVTSHGYFTVVAYGHVVLLDVLSLRSNYLETKMKHFPYSTNGKEVIHLRVRVGCSMITNLFRVPKRVSLD